MLAPGESGTAMAVDALRPTADHIGRALILFSRVETRAQTASGSPVVLMAGPVSTSVVSGLLDAGIVRPADSPRPAPAQPSFALSTPGASITLQAAEVLLDAAEARARELRVPMTIVVVDAGGQLKALRRMDGAPGLTATVGLNKAYTAAQFGAPTHALAGLFAGSPALFQGITALANITLIGGGYPVMQGQIVIGGIGVSGGTEAQDRDVAEAALAALMRTAGAQ